MTSERRFLVASWARVRWVNGMSDANADKPGEPEEEPMRYGMLGEDQSTTGEKLEKYTGEVGWKYLRPHFESGALVYVDPSLSITEVGQAFADDDSEQVGAWRQSGDLVTPSQPHADFWEESGAMFRALVVTPFVLIQPLDSGN